MPPFSGLSLPRDVVDAHLDRYRDEPLLCAVVQVTFEAAPLGISGLDDARA